MNYSWPNDIFVMITRDEYMQFWCERSILRAMDEQGRIAMDEDEYDIEKDVDGFSDILYGAEYD